MSLYRCNSWQSNKYEETAGRKIQIRFMTAQQSNVGQIQTFRKTEYLTFNFVNYGQIYQITLFHDYLLINNYTW